MPIEKIVPQWQKRLSQIDCRAEAIRFCRDGENEIAQDRECCEVVVDGRRRRIRFHDYHELYEVPGLYEQVFYERLQCSSPERIVQLLEDLVEEFGGEMSDLNVLDVGAGNGVVGEEYRIRGTQRLVGIDIIAEAKDAAYRDRPEVYDDYLVTDLTDLPEPDEKRLRTRHFNCLASVAALGFGDLPSDAFIKALDLIDTPGWVAFNIKEDFLHQRDQTGFCGLVHQLTREEVIQIQAYRRYRHRLSITGKPLHYVAIVARKLKDIPDHLIAEKTEESNGE